MRALLDTDVVLDLLLDRPGFAEHAAALWEANEQGRSGAYISAITPVNVFYIARKLKGADTARQAVTELLQALRVCPLDMTTYKARWPSHCAITKMLSSTLAHLPANWTRSLLATRTITGAQLFRCLPRPISSLNSPNEPRLVGTLEE